MLDIYHNLTVLLGGKSNKLESAIHSESGSEGERYTPATRRYYFRYENR